MQDIHTYIRDLKGTLDELPMEAIQRVISILLEARLHDRHIFIMGNGGSASTASHFVCDLAKNTRKDGWPHFRVVGLSDNMAILSAYANDEGYESVFASQLANLVRPDDVVIGISTSGNSANVLRAVELANETGAATIGFTGFDGGQLARLVQVNVHVASDIIEQVEDIHLMLEHMITKALREQVLETAGMLSLSGTDGFSRLSAGAERQSFELLKSLNRELQGQLDLSTLLQRTLQVTVESVGADSGSIMVLDEKGDLVEGAIAYAGEVRKHAIQQLADTLKRGLAGWVVHNRKPAVISSTNDDPRWLRRAWEGEAGASRAAISVPLMAGDRVVGVLTLVYPKERRLTDGDVTLLTAIAVCVSLNGADVMVLSDVAGKVVADGHLQAPDPESGAPGIPG